MVKLVSEQKIIDFRVLYAPQVYNIDPEAVLDMRCRRVIASNGYICSIWMRLMVKYMVKYVLGMEDGRHNGAGICSENFEVLELFKSAPTLTFAYEITENQIKLCRISGVLYEAGMKPLITEMS